jgi:AraC-like DNA-binding protein
MALREPKNTSRYWTAPSVRGLSLMLAEFTTQEFPPHTHDGFVVAVTESGGSEIKSRGDVAQADARGLFIFNPEEPHAGWMGRSTYWRYRSFYMTKAAMNQLADDLGVKELPYFLGNRFGDADLIEAFLAAHSGLGADHEPMAARQLMIEAFAKLFSRHGCGQRPVRSGASDEHRVRQAIDLMRSRYGEQLTLEELAHPLGVSIYQLIGLFKRTVGLTPHAYLTQVRLGEACSRLKRGMGVAETAAVCGFYDQSALSNHFRRCYALTPVQFARAYAQRIPRPNCNFRQDQT